MGLDNGIKVKKKDNIQFKPNILGEYNEICYWRKCWNVRNAIINYLDKTYSINEDNYKWQLNIDDVKAIIKILSSYNKNNWVSGIGGSIWEWDEIKDKIKTQIKHLKYLTKQMRIHGDNIEVYFYDSY